MTREQAKELLPIITAYAEGKKIEYQTGEGNWEDVKRGLAFIDPVSNYRIAPEKKYRPFTMEEFLPHRDRWVFADNSLWKIQAVFSSGIKISLGHYDFKSALEKIKFENNDPFGVLE